MLSIKRMMYYCAAALLAVAGASSHAALVNQGDGTILDTNTNLLWLYNWNKNGSATWESQNNWAESLQDAGFSDWDLPTIDQWSTLYGSVGSTWGGLTDIFGGVQYATYWLDTELNAGAAWSRATWSTMGFTHSKSSNFYATAVRENSALVVPEPAPIVLIIGGFIGLALFGNTRSMKCRHAGFTPVVSK